MSDSGNDTLEKMLFFAIELTQRIDVLLKISGKNIFEVSGLLDLKRSD